MLSLLSLFVPVVPEGGDNEITDQLGDLFGTLGMPPKIQILENKWGMPSTVSFNYSWVCLVALAGLDLKILYTICICDMRYVL